MTVRKYYIGGMGPYLYDDAELINDADGDFAGEYQSGLVTDGPIKTTNPAIENDDVLRLADVNGIVTIAYILALLVGKDVVINTLDVDEIFNTGGDIKINADAQGNVNLFSDTDVDDAADGKKLTVTRRAAEGDTTIYIYVKNDTSAQIQSTQDLEISSSVASGVISLGTVATNVVRLVGSINSIGKGTGTDNFPLRHYGYITAGGLSGQKYVQWLLDDTDDFFHLTRQTDLILGLKIEMPVDIDGPLSIQDLTASLITATNASKELVSVPKQAHIVDADGSLADITTKFNTLLSQLESFGILET